MLRTASTQALLIAVLTALASFCALKASAGQPATPRRYSIVAQSSKATAATGRRPISQRIAASNLPLLIPVREGCNEHGCPAPTADTPLVQPPVAEESPSEQVETSEQNASNEPAPPAMLADTDDPEAIPEESIPEESIPDEAEPDSEPSEATDALLARVKTALAAKRQHAEAKEAAAALPPEQPLTGVPARLEFNVRESRSLVKEGEQIVVRIAVRNVGGEPAAEVNATLFFAEGMEPVQAIGHSAEVYPGEVRFGTLKEISPGDSVDLLVTAIGTRPGSVTYRGELECSQLGGRIAREGAVTVRPRKPAAE
jgi:hypothetical protein